MELIRDLGLMQIDENNLWIDIPLEEAIRAQPEDKPLPPEVSEEWLQTAFEGDAKSQPQIVDSPELTVSHPVSHRPESNRQTESPQSEDRTVRKSKWMPSRGIPSLIK